jgi:FKBP-type peptidyl-prolyl cis-trans isomerase
MKKKGLLFLLLTLNMSLMAQVTKNALPESFGQKLSYAVGYDVTKSLRKMDVDLSKEWMMQGIIDALTDSLGNPVMTNEEMELVFQELQERNMAKLQGDQENQAIPNREAGKKYVEDQMSSNPKIKKTGSGLVYEVIKNGTGKMPAANSSVKVKYKGYLIDGTVFDESNATSSFKLTEVIPGWTEGIQLMKEGAIYKLIIPANLAYGNSPPPNTGIQPGSTLCFTIELIKIEK